MTRFLMKIEESIGLVEKSISLKTGGSILVKKSPATKTINLAKVLIKIFQSKSKIKNIGIRPGEKKYETLITREEMAKTKCFPDHYIITNKIINKISDETTTDYHSNNTKQLSDKELEKLLLSLPEIKKALNSY